MVNDKLTRAVHQRAGRSSRRLCGSFRRRATPLRQSRATGGSWTTLCRVNCTSGSCREVSRISLAAARQLSKKNTHRGVIIIIIISTFVYRHEFEYNPFRGA